MNRILTILMAAILAGCSGGKKSPFSHTSDTKSLEKIFSVLEADRVTAIRYQDWCKVISYKRGSFANVTDSTCTYVATGTTAAFDSTAESDLERIWKKVNSTGTGVFVISDVQFNSSGELIHGEFECSSGFTPQRYVFDPGYHLPADLPNERWHTRINSDWYYILEDWN